MTPSCLQVLWNTFCSDCNSVPFSGSISNGVHDGLTVWPQHNLHEMTSGGCLDDADGNSACQIQVCGKHVPVGLSTTHQEELYAQSVTLPSHCSVTGKQGYISSVKHATFMVDCGQMSKLVICVAKSQSIFSRHPPDVTCLG